MKWYNFKNATQDKPARLDIQGVIGSDWEGISDIAVANALKQFDGQQLNVHINSPGGDAFAGVAIYNMLKTRNGNTSIYVDGLAASAASIIAMAGNEIIMGLGSMMMIHNPWTITGGDANQLRKAADMLDKLGTSLAEIYAVKTGMSVDAIKDLLDKETWMSAQEAVDEGFATSTSETKGSMNYADISQMRFMNCPKELLNPSPLAEKLAEVRDQLRFENNKLSAQIDETNAKLNTATSECESLRSQVQNLSTNVDTLTAENTALKDVSAKLTESNAALASANAKLAELQERLNVIANAGARPVEQVPAEQAANEESAILEEYLAFKNAVQRHYFYKKHQKVLDRLKSEKGII